MKSENFWMNSRVDLAHINPVAGTCHVFQLSKEFQMSKSRSNAATPKFTPKVPLTSAAVSRVQGALDKQHSGQTPKDSYVRDMQRVVAKRPA